MLGYAIGFWPEETRSDRNSYVHINDDNVLTPVVDNFPINSDNNYSVPFDYCSIMFHHDRVQVRSTMPDVMETINTTKKLVTVILISVHNRYV